MAEITMQLVRDIDRKLAELDRDFALHRQGTQYQITDTNTKLDDLTRRVQTLESRKPAIGPQIVQFLFSPTVIKWAIGGGSGAVGYLASRLML